MSYRLIDANNIAFNSDGFITAENIVKMPCIYADLPNGMDGKHYVLEQEPCEDAISRTEVIKSIDEREDVNGKVDAESVRTDIVLMPSVNPQEPFKPMVEIDLYSVIKQKYIEREVLDKIRAEIDRQQKWLLQAGYATCNVDIALDAIKAVVAEKE